MDYRTEHSKLRVEAVQRTWQAICKIMPNKFCFAFVKTCDVFAHPKVKKVYNLQSAVSWSLVNVEYTLADRRAQITVLKQIGQPIKWRIEEFTLQASKHPQTAVLKRVFLSMKYRLTAQTAQNHLQRSSQPERIKNAALYKNLRSWSVTYSRLMRGNHCTAITMKVQFMDSINILESKCFILKQFTLSLDKQWLRGKGWGSRSKVPDSNLSVIH